VQGRGRGVRAAEGPGRLRTGVTLAGVLLVAAATQVIPTLSLPPVTAATVAGNLPAISFDARIQANLERVAAAVTGAEPDQGSVFQSILDEGRKLLHFDPDESRGRGSWAELVGELNEHTETVGVLVPGSTAFIFDKNFNKYRDRANHMVEESDGKLAMVVWAAGDFPSGWLKGAMTRYQATLGRALAIFSQELRAEIDRELGPDHDVQVVVAGHSFGGAVVGGAERYGLQADVVLHVASVGMGTVHDPYDYPDPTRPRYSMTAPGDLIGFVQGVPAPPGLGHGPDPDTFRCVTTLPIGRLPDDPTALNEDGEPIGDRAGDKIVGIHSHSDVFIRHSDAWWQIYRVFRGQAPPAPDCPPPDGQEPVKARVLPLAVPRVVTDSQCRAGGGLRPGGRHRPPNPST